MLSDKPLAQAQRPVTKRKKKGEIGLYADQQKIEAVQMYVLHGNIRLVSRILGIEDRTLRYWKTTEWWKEVESELRAQENIQLTSNLKKQVDKAMELVQDRLENGDWIYDPRTGEMRRKPVPLRDAHKVVTDFIDRRHKLITTEEAKVQADDIKKRLANLAKTFEEFAHKQEEKPPVIVTDVIFQTENKENDNNSSPVDPAK